MLRIIILAVWALIISSHFVYFPGSWNMILQNLGIVLLLAHVAEYFIFRQKIIAKGDSTGRSIVATLLYGIFYINGKV